MDLSLIFVTWWDEVEKGHENVDNCPIGEMTTDFIPKPLQGRLFEKFQSHIMGVKNECCMMSHSQQANRQDCVGLINWITAV
jgi:hypothetical protein